MIRIAVAGMMHETNSFALEENDGFTAMMRAGEAVLSEAHPKSYIGGFVDGAKRPDVQLVPLADVSFINRGGTIYKHVFEHYRDLILDGLRKSLPLDAVYLALHGAAAVQAPYEDAEASLIRSIRHAHRRNLRFSRQLHGVGSAGRCAIPAQHQSAPRFV